MPLNLSFSWGGKSAAIPPPLPATPPPLPVTQSGAEPVKKSGGNLEPFNRLIGQAGENNPLQRPMAQSVWVMSAIEKVTEPICDVPMEFALTDSDGSDKPYKNPALKTFWDMPCKGMKSREEFIRASVGWLNLAGEVFYILDDSWLLKSVAKNPLIMARPGSMREMVNPTTDELVGWYWMQGNGQRAELIADQVIQVKRWNPYNKWRGLSKMEAARIAAEADYLQGTFALNLAANNGDQGVYVIASGTMPTEDQQRQIIMALQMKADAARKGRLRPVFLAGDIKIEDPKIQTPDADFTAQRLENRHEIYIAFDVPPSMADVVASYSIGSASDRYALIQNTCIPTTKHFTKVFAEISLRFLRMDPATPLTCTFNFAKHPVMVQARLEMLTAADKLWAKGVPMKACNDYLGLQLPEFDGWDQGYIPFNVTPVGEAVDPTTDPSFAEKPAKPNPDDEDGDEVKSLRNLFARRAGPNSPECIATKAATAAEKLLWKKHAAARKPSVRRYQAAINKCLDGAKHEMLSKLAAHYTTVGKSIVTKAGASEYFMFNLHSFAAEFKAGMDGAARAAFDDAGQQVYDELGKDDPWESPPAKVKEFIAARENKLSNVSEEIFDQVKRQLDQGVDQGDSIKDLASRIAGEFDTIKAGRATTIASTETSAAFGTARQLSMKTAGVQYKKWLTSGNTNVREAHQEAQGQVRQIDEPFNVDGEEIDYPGDPDGSGENVINCHCVSIAESGGAKDDYYTEDQES